MRTCGSAGLQAGNVMAHAPSSRHKRHRNHEDHQEAQAFGRLRRLPCADQPENGGQSALRQNCSRQTMFRNIQSGTGKDLERMPVLRCDGKRGQPGLQRMRRLWLAAVSLSTTGNCRTRIIPHRESSTVADWGEEHIFCQPIPGRHMLVLPS